jgi:uncharacterized membrane-anchored protein
MANVNPSRSAKGARKTAAPAVGRELLNKVPEITVFFWIIKVLCTTVGETAADFLNTKLNLGVTITAAIMTGLLVGALVWQFAAKRYVPTVYWIAVVLISVVGTLLTDFLTDTLNVPLEASTAGFAVLLAATFFLWYRAEKTLSIRSITTTRREAFYWAAILFTFALGTAAGDWLAEFLSETFSLGFGTSAIIFGALIAAVTLAHYRFKLNTIVAFWIAYVLTRPLGASLGDLLSQDKDAGGLGLGTVVTSAIFLGAILVSVVYLSVTKKDAVAGEAPTRHVALDGDVDAE